MRIEMKRLYLPLVIALLTAMLVAPVAMAAGPDHDNNNAKANAPGQVAKNSEDTEDNGSTYAPGVLANESEDPDDNGKTYAPGLLKKAEPR
ncbi:hypothetical protein A3F07_03885 [candidate division WWE3 bacterium RIFCSPHIGHO2_12_FULL_38_15]|nr:MAG: hypothetical protein A3F07_03885 [candidate division WWE3 bacterium RIFCSPHIGHO2_12_FULL_38_15]